MISDGKLFCFFVTFAFVVEGINGAKWTYEEIAAWDTLSGSFCNGTKQSPIDISTSSAKINNKLGPFPRQLFTAIPTTERILNNGHSLQVDLTGGYVIDDKKLLPAVYKPAQFHFHWALSGSKEGGSEHTLNGKRYFAEMHIVHVNNATPSNYLTTPDGLAVLGFFIQAQGNVNHTGFEMLLNYGRQVTYAKESSKITQLFPLSEVMPATLGTYYRYSGSLTTPNCNEVVVWTVFEAPITISVAQKLEWQSMFYGNAAGTNSSTLIGNNYRPVQPLNGRFVSKYAATTGGGNSGGGTSGTGGAGGSGGGGGDGGAGSIHPHSLMLLLSVAAVLAACL